MADNTPKTQTIKTVGIYHGLPTFPPSYKLLSALVVGARGISGQHMINVLSQSPKRWTKIYALSRSPPSIPTAIASLVIHVPVDLLKSPQDIAQMLIDGNVKADYIFFSAYLQPSPPPGEPLWSNSDELDRVNSRILSNFLSSLPIAGIQPQRIVLQTGLKHYGAHLGPMKKPMSESDPRLPSPPYPPNFYYTQEDLLFSYSKSYPSTSWNVIRPCWILGAVPGAAMNILFPLAVYASVQTFLGGSLDFPGDWQSWDQEQMHSSAMLIGYLNEWAALTPAAKNHAFNAADGGPWTWSFFWPILASWYGIQWTGPAVDEGKYVEIKMDIPPRGWGPPGNLRYSFSLIDWAKQPVVQEAWIRISQLNNLSVDPFKELEQIWEPIQIALVSSWSWVVRLDNSRKMGWNGYVDTLEVVRQVFEQFSELKMIPPVPKLEALIEKPA